MENGTGFSKRVSNYDFSVILAFGFKLVSAITNGCVNFWQGSRAQAGGFPLFQVGAYRGG
jgi:hypothetical protein